MIVITAGYYIVLSILFAVLIVVREGVMEDLRGCISGEREFESRR